MASYSGTPLLQKLGIKPGSAVTVINQPAHYLALLGPLPEGAHFRPRIVAGCEFVHLFTTDRDELKKYLIRLRSKLADAGTIWISWPKKTSGVETNVREDVIRALALPLGFVDTKVCAVDETWSGLKLMIRRGNRGGASKK
jgi:hypothetical protein